MLTFYVVTNDGWKIDRVTLDDKVITQFDTELQRTDLSMMVNHIGEKVKMIYDYNYKSYIEVVIKSVTKDENGYTVHFERE